MNHAGIRMGWFTSISLMLGSAALAEQDPTSFLTRRSNHALGFEQTQNLAEGSNANAIWLFRQEHEWQRSGDAHALRFRLNYQLECDTAEAPKLELRKLIATAEGSLGPIKLTVGQDEVSWGENLLMPILDLVNPRDFQNPRGYYDPASKIPVPMARAEWQQEDWSADIIAVPAPVRSIQPSELAGFKVEDSRRYRLGIDGEYGGRVGIFVQGVDLKLYTLSYWPRVPAYRFTPYAGSIEIVERKAEMKGASASYAAESWLMRLDYAHQSHVPATQIASRIEHSDLDQGILGLSWSSETQQTLGTEIHIEHWSSLPTAYQKGAWAEERRRQRFMSWLGFNGSLRWFDGKIEPGFLALRGLNSEDKLLRLTGQWNANSSSTVGAEYQRSEAASNSPKVLLSQRETFSLRLTYNW